MNNPDTIKVENTEFGKTELGFINHFKSSPYKLDQFIELTKKCLQENGFSITQEKVKTGEAITYAGGITLHGEVGGGAATTSISKLTWNPMHIEYMANGNSFLKFSQ